MNARKSKTPVELATEFVSESIESAKAAFSPEAGAAKESLDAINQAATAYQARLVDFQQKGVEMAEANTKAAFAFWRGALASKTPEALFSLQQDFVKAQAEATVKQVQDLNAMTLAAVKEAAAPIQASVSKAFAAFQPAKAA